MDLALSPCVESAVNQLPQEVTAWDFARCLIVMHPEYTQGKMKAHIAEIDKSYKGEKKPIYTWLKDISIKYPNEDLFHTQLVILGLFNIDPTLHKLIPYDAMAIIENNIILK